MDICPPIVHELVGVKKWNTAYESAKKQCATIDRTLEEHRKTLVYDLFISSIENTEKFDLKSLRNWK